MRMGEHRAQLAASTRDADLVHWFQPEGLDWSLEDVIESGVTAAQLHTDIDALVGAVSEEARDGDQVVIMSNGGFGGIHRKLLDSLEGKLPRV